MPAALGGGYRDRSTALAVSTLGSSTHISTSTPYANLVQHMQMGSDGLG